MIRTGVFTYRYFRIAALFIFSLSLGTTVAPFSTDAANSVPQFTSASEAVKANETHRNVRVAVVHNKEARQKTKNKLKKAAKKVDGLAKDVAKKAAKKAKKKAAKIGKKAKNMGKMAVEKLKK